ncbi:hypothetical protein J2Z76_001232 [Sedimentibacter acidaminivorans]|uniref:Uncharacterized protein n=1 Tax=Sedimentibacter acidaminivorans TaxID=913099 RepID=A0ABS4GCF1_9FIRM|nr:hypothetical protein [Sedimentibacter acidaminivorans]MBP1925373.1 hypothetical protein [Sedimentibacter acidaminivorans]
MKMKMNKSLTTGSLLIGLGLSAAAVYAVAPTIKNLANNKSNKEEISNNNNMDDSSKNSIH